MRDNYGSVSFTPACNTHDICYATPGKTQRQCDDAFRKDMYSACKGQSTACFSLADIYYASVSVGAGGAYKDAQQCSARVQAENERVDADALIALSLAEASKQGNAAMQDVQRASSEKLRELEAIAAEANAAYARITTLLAESNPAAPSPAPASTGKYAVIAEPPDHYVHPGQPQLVEPSVLAKQSGLRNIEAKARPIIDLIQKQIVSARNVDSNIHTTASRTAAKSSETRGKEVRALATEAKTAFGSPAMVGTALQKVAAARTKFFAFRADIAQDITHQTSSWHQSLERTVLPMEHQKHEVLMLRNEAERVAKGDLPPPKRELVPRTPVLPGKKR